MKVLLSKEIKSIFCSSAGLLFVIVFPLILGLILWLFSGRYNIIENGYASLQPFFYLAPILLLILVPALTMGSFADEKNKKTLDTLLSRPIHIFYIYLSKFLSVFIFLFTSIIATLVYVYTVYQLGNPIGNIDSASTFSSYLSLLCITAVLISIGLFASSCTNNQIVAFVLALLLNLFAYYGFSFLASFVSTGALHNTIAAFGVSHHYQSMQRGVVELSDFVTLISYIIIFIALTLIALKRANRNSIVYLIAIILAINVLNIALPYQRIDFTADKRYTLNRYTIHRLNELRTQNRKVSVVVHLTGDLNSEFQYLQDALYNTLTDMNKYAGNSINIVYENPYAKYDSLEEMYKAMDKKGMRGIVLNEVDREGKTSQKILFPYVEVETEEATLTVSLLKNMEGYSASENINASIENIEFELVDALRILNQKEPKHIAFIEGHGELAQHSLNDAEELLSKYYFVNRGSIEGNNLESLRAMDALIITGTSEAYSDSEKYLIDQYIMSGGKILWLLDGVKYSPLDLITKGYSPSIKNETNLDDILFSYGVRINADIVQDTQCTSIYIMSGNNTESSVLVPNYYSPLLMPSLDNPITRSIRDVKANFASSIDFVNNKSALSKKILLTSSTNTRLIKASETIDFDLAKIQKQMNLFDQSFVPAAVSLEGQFQSAFNNRMTNDSNQIKESVKTKMIVVSNSQIIKNDSNTKEGETLSQYPMGYDKVSRQQYGNRDFLVNALNWLTDDDGWMELRIKKQEIRSLNRKKALDERDKYAAINILAPILIGLILIGSIFLYRKKKYSK